MTYFRFQLFAARLDEARPVFEEIQNFISKIDCRPGGTGCREVSMEKFINHFAKINGCSGRSRCRGGRRGCRRNVSVVGGGGGGRWWWW